MKTTRGVDDNFASTFDGLKSSSDDNVVIEFGSVDKNNDNIVMIMTKKIITNALAKLNLNYVSLLIKLAQPFNLNVE